MSVMFQLFHAEDLQKLDEPAFDALVNTIREANRKSGDPVLQKAAESDLASHWLEARNSLNKIDLTEITKALRSRASQVFKQLRGRSPDQPRGALEFNKPDFPIVKPSSHLLEGEKEAIRRQILAQLLTEEELKNLSSLDFKILDVAMSCELSYFLSFNHLQHIRKTARQRYSESFTPPKRPSLDPDSPLSSYPPGHRLHDIR